MATRIVNRIRVPESEPGESEPPEGQAADSHPEVPTGTPEPRPSGTPT
jgi:hypothetical protein